MKNYEELLKLPEWKAKRLEILKRDKHTCQRCGINNKSHVNSLGVEFNSENFIGTYFRFFNYNEIDTQIVNIKVVREDVEITAKTNINDLDIDYEHYYFLFNYIHKDYVYKNFSGSVLLKETNLDIFNKNDKLNNFLKFKNKLNDNEWLIDKEGVWFIKKENIYDYVKDNIHLHIHHKCYRKNIEIWAQDENEYVTLCNICHLLTHQNYKIPYFDESGRIIANLSACKKCGGLKYLKQYKHVNNGICFRCNGIGFENLNM